MPRQQLLKTTVTFLITHILNHAKIKARALGNMGEPLLSFTGPEDEVLVVELSSFQLETLDQKYLDAAIILNLTPDHLDRYPSMHEYAEAKIRIKNALKEKGFLYVNIDVGMRYFSHAEYYV